MTPDLTVVIPAFNESSVIERTLEKVTGYLANRSFEIVVSDDGSTDGTAALVEGAASRDQRIRLVRFPENRGKGNALRLGVGASRGQRILCTDADLVFGFDHLERYLSAIDGGAAVAAGNRSHVESRFILHAKDFPYLNQRHWMGRIFSFLVRMMVDLDVPDTQCGFKVFDGSIGRDLFARTRVDGFAYDVEVLSLAKRSGHHCVALPVSIHYEGNPSSVRLAQNALPMLLDVWRIRCEAKEEEKKR